MDKYAQRSLHRVNYKQTLEKMPHITQAWKITTTDHFLPFDAPGKRSKRQNADYYPGSYSQAGRNRSRFTHVEANTCQPISQPDVVLKKCWTTEQGSLVRTHHPKESRLRMPMRIDAARATLT